MTKPITWVGILACLVAALPEAAAEPGPNSAAAISAVFADSCRTFIAQSSKDISHVELLYADGRVVKDESIDGPEFEVEGGAGNELEAAIVKSGTTTRLFECALPASPPVALLEIRTPAGNLLEGCFDFFAGGLMCNQSTPRVEWTSADQVPDTGGGASGIFHWGCPDLSLCSFIFSFRGSASTDPDGDIASWSLDFGDGTSAGGSWATDPPTEVSHDYSSAVCSPCVITLTVTDASGQSGSMSMKMAFVDVTPD
jgi:hypothetical protein